MKKGNLRKKAYLSVIALFLAVGIAFSCLCSPDSKAVRRIYSFLGLSDFSSCADSYPVSVHVLDVGKADSILVESGGSFMLVDGGTPDRGKDVCAYLMRRGVSHLEYMVNSHPDEDHIGGLKYVADTFPVQNYFAPDIPRDLIPTDNAYLATQKSLKRKGIKAISPKPGSEFGLNGLKIRVLGPVRPGNSTNNNSLVLLLTYGKIRFLLMGDAEKEEENDLLTSGESLSADVLKVGHHGSKTSSTKKFLEAVKPEYAAVSVGYDRNKLPNRSVLQSLSDSGASVWRTDVSGTLIFLTDGQTVTVRTEK